MQDVLSTPTHLDRRSPEEGDINKTPFLYTDKRDTPNEDGHNQGYK